MERWGACAVGLLCLVTCLAVHALEVEQGVWGELLTLDCEGRLHLLANSLSAVSVDLGDASEAHEFWVDKFMERARERCAVSDPVLKTVLPTLEWALNWIVDPATDRQPLPCDEQTQPNQPSVFLSWLPCPDARGSAGIVAASTCSKDTLSNGKGCLLEYEMDPKKLPNTRL